MNRLGRLLAVAGLAAGLAVALARYLSAGNSLAVLGPVALPLLTAGVLKGAVLRFLGTVHPYRSAIVANTVSELIGLGFSLSSFGMPWGALGMSVVTSTGIESVVLWLFSAARPAVCLGRAFYMNLVAHGAVGGLLLFYSSTLWGGLLIAGSFMLLILPIFLVERGLRGEAIISGQQGGPS